MTDPTVDRAVEDSASLVGSPPGALPEEQGGSAAMVGNREAEGDNLPEGATPISPAVTPQPTAEPVTAEPAEPEPELEVS